MVWGNKSTRSKVFGFYIACELQIAMNAKNKSVILSDNKKYTHKCMKKVGLIDSQGILTQDGIDIYNALLKEKYDFDGKYV